MDDLNHLNITNQELIDWCDRWRQLLAKDNLGRDRILGDCCSNTLLRLNDHAVVKFGVSVTASEAANQEFAWKALRSSFSSVRVPQVYRFFQDSAVPENHWQGRVGYLVMEFVPGKRLSDLPPGELPFFIDKVAQAVQAISRIKSDHDTPGPLDGGEPKGPLWAPDNRAYEKFRSVDDLEAWFNRALIKDSLTIDLRQYPLSFCHLDLARRNILRVDNQTICLLDWATAGFYPRVVEIWNIEVTNANDASYAKSLVRQLPCLSIEEHVTHWLLWCAYRRNMLYSL